MVYGGGVHASDMVVAPIVAVLHPASDTGFSLQMHPGDAGLAWGDSWLESDAGGFAWHRDSLRISASTVQTFNMHLAAHAACWRPALGFSVARYPKHWVRDRSSEFYGLSLFFAALVSA